MFWFITILTALGIILVLAAIPMLALGKGSPLLLARPSRSSWGRRSWRSWSTSRAMRRPAMGEPAGGVRTAPRIWSFLAIALGVVAVALLLPTIRGRDGNRLIAGSGAVVSLAAFVFLWFMAMVHTLNLS